MTMATACPPSPEPCTSNQSTSNVECLKSKSQKNMTESRSFECPVCLQTPVHPVKLPCSHVFCFLCVKGLGNSDAQRYATSTTTTTTATTAGWHADARCPMCRQCVPRDYIVTPVLVVDEQNTAAAAVDDDDKNQSTDDTSSPSYSWLYAGRQDGWWQFDERTAADIERAYETQQQSVDLLIAGHIYTVDLVNMCQYRRNTPARRRRIKRVDHDINDDAVEDGVKGVAGLKRSLLADT